MGLLGKARQQAREHLSTAAVRTTEVARAASETATADRARQQLAAFQALLSDRLPTGPDGIAPEQFVVLLVGKARSADDEDLSDRDVVRAAKSRWRRGRAAALGATVFAGAANHLVDLYCETAMVCDLVRLHELPIDDVEIAARMLVLWDVADDVGQAEAAMNRSDSSITQLLRARAGAQAQGRVPEQWTAKALIQALWRTRGLATEVSAGSGAVTGIVMPGKTVKRFHIRARVVLGIEG